MTDLRQLERVLDQSSDPDNPGAEEIRRIVTSVRHVAVVGISRDPVKAARRVPSYMAANGYDIIPVNPNATRILGRRAHASLEGVTDPVDMVLIFRPPDEAGPFLRDAASRPERPVVWLQEGIRADEAAAEARAEGVTVVQDLCFYKVHRSLRLSVRSLRARRLH